jgi:hypothetical protein
MPHLRRLEFVKRRGQKCAEEKVEYRVRTYEGVHVEDPVEGVDLGEGGDVHWEAAVWEYHAEHVRFGYRERPSGCEV